MADTFKGIITADGKKRTFAREGITPEYVSDKTLSVDGGFADAKATGDAVKSLKEDIDNLSSSKISKFYATNNGENHLADSDDGKIADMMVYGKSEQKQYSGRNLMPIFDDFETTVSGVSIKAKNGLITLEGNSIAAIGYSIPLKETITLPDENIYMHLRNNAELAGSSLVFKNENGQVDFASISSINRVLLAPPLTGQPISEIMLSLGEGIAFKGFKMQPSLELTDEATTFEPYTGGKPSPSPDYPQEIKSVVNPTVKVTNEDGLKVQSVTLNNITLNAIPVSSGGNVTINGQQYIADYVDVERGKLVRNIENATFNGAENENWTLWNENEDNLWSFMFQNSIKAFVNESASKCNRFEFDANESIDRTFLLCNPSGNPSLQIKNRIIGKDITAFKSWLSNNPIDVIYPLRIPIEEELTAEHAQALKELATYYPVTNISISSEQLDGYTVFNYPISMANGWNYVKQQLNDNRDYIYDMDTKTQDIDTQAAEAYVNSEYAVALTELEV